jgi:hypothetical protein
LPVTTPLVVAGSGSYDQGIEGCGALSVRVQNYRIQIYFPD